MVVLPGARTKPRGRVRQSGEGGGTNGGRGRGRSGGEGKEGTTDNSWWSEDVNVVGIGQDKPIHTHQLLKPAEEGVQAKGKELGAKWAALTNTAPRGNDGGEGVIHAEEKVSGR